MNNKKRISGFTLIELLVVIVIIGILATLAAVALNSARAKARDARRISDIKQIQTALELYFNDQQKYPTDVDSGVGSFVIGKPFISPDSFTTYMAKVPSNPTPVDGDCLANSAYVYKQIDNGNAYTIDYCLGSVVSSVGPGLAKAVPGSINIIDKNSCAVNGGVITVSDNRCTNSATGPMALSGYDSGVTINYWEKSANNGITWTQLANSANQNSYADNDGHMLGVVKYRVKITGSSCSTYSAIKDINFFEIPTTSNAGPDQTTVSTVVTLAANQPADGTGRWEYVSGATGNIANTSQRNTTFTKVGAGTSSVLKWVISNPPCVASEDSVTINWQ